MTKGLREGERDTTLWWRKTHGFDSRAREAWVAEAPADQDSEEVVVPSVDKELRKWHRLVRELVHEDALLHTHTQKI